MNCLYLGFIISIIFSFPAFAEATPSVAARDNIVRSDSKPIDNIDSVVRPGTPDDYKDIDKEVKDKDATDKMDSDKISESDALDITSVTESFKNALNEFYHDTFDYNSSDNADNIESLDSGNREVLLMDRNQTENFKNVVVFTGNIGNDEYDLVVPYEQYKNLTWKNGKLVNVGSSSITGSLINVGSNLDTESYDKYVYVLNPITNNPSSVYSYGNYNFVRHYYESTGSYQRIVYDDTYTNFIVSDVKIYFQSSERNYYIGILIAFILGVQLLWKRH